MSDDYEKECEECRGSGEVEILQYCLKPMSDCCGGCYETRECEDCEGSGYIYQED